MPETKIKNTGISGLALDCPATYFPLSDGRYHVTPRLFRFGTNFGNADADKKFFQIDTDFFLYRENKLKAREERLGKYYCDVLKDSTIARRMQAHIIKRLLHEHPSLFQLEIGKRVIGLHCQLTGEVIIFDKAYNYEETRGAGGIRPEYLSGLDALACQFQEDIAIITTSEGTGNTLAALHLCFPNHWSAEDKIDKSFDVIHEPVAGMEASNEKSAQIVSSMIHHGPYVRFAWGIATDRRLNHHPVAPDNQSDDKWRGRKFGEANDNLYLRIERQTTSGFADINAALFTIHTYFVDIAGLRKTQPLRTKAIYSAIESMTNAQLKYKGLYQEKDKILSWLEAD